MAFFCFLFFYLVIPLIYTIDPILMAPKRIRESPKTRRTRPRRQPVPIDQMFASLPQRIDVPPGLGSLRVLRNIEQWNTSRTLVGNRPPQWDVARTTRWAQRVQNLYRLEQIIKEDIDNALSDQIIPTGNQPPGNPPPPPPPPAAGGGAPNIIFA